MIVAHGTKVPVLAIEVPAIFEALAMIDSLAAMDAGPWTFSIEKKLLVIRFKLTPLVCQT